MTDERAPETVPAVFDDNGYDSFRINGAVVRWWSLKRDAQAGARAIGWPARSVVRVHTRFAAGYAILQHPDGLLTRQAYGRLWRSRNESADPGL